MHDCYNVTITVSRDGGQLPDPVTFGAAADRAAWCRSASIVSAHTADKIISVVTVHAPDRFAAEAVARAVVFDALRAPSASSGNRMMVALGRGSQLIRSGEMPCR